MFFQLSWRPRRLVRPVKREIRCLWLGNVEVLADSPRKEFIDFTMPWNSGGFSGSTTDVNRMFSGITEELAAMTFQMLDNISAFQEIAVTRRSSRTSQPRMDSSAKARFASNTN